MLILDPWGISFHPAVVVGLGNDLLFNSILGHCARGYVYCFCQIFQRLRLFKGVRLSTFLFYNF